MFLFDYIQVTYPYIMAKVRVQARGADDSEDAAEKGVASAKKAPKYNGALDVLSKVYKENGFVGWYKVCSKPTPSKSCFDSSPNATNPTFSREWTLK